MYWFLIFSFFDIEYIKIKNVYSLSHSFDKLYWAHNTSQTLLQALLYINEGDKNKPPSSMGLYSFGKDQQHLRTIYKDSRGILIIRRITKIFREAALDRAIQDTFREIVADSVTGAVGFSVPLSGKDSTCSSSNMCWVQGQVKQKKADYNAFRFLCD